MDAFRDLMVDRGWCRFRSVLSWRLWPKLFRKQMSAAGSPLYRLISCLLHIKAAWMRGLDRTRKPRTRNLELAVKNCEAACGSLNLCRVIKEICRASIMWRLRVKRRLRPV